jgi:hypothetical protein
MAATEALGSPHAASTRALSSAAWRRRGALLICMVSTSDIGGHHAGRYPPADQGGSAGRLPGTCRSSSGSTPSWATSRPCCRARTYKAFGYAKYADRYLGAFAYRFNRRFDLADLVVRLIVDVCRGKAAPERVIRHA